MSRQSITEILKKRAMKTILLIIIIFLLSTGIAVSQTFDATIAIDDVDVTNILPGDDVIIPIRLEYMEPGGGLIVIDLFIEYDHTILTWKGTTEDPLPGVTNFNPVMPYSPADWYFADDSTAVYSSWACPTFCWVNIPDGEQFFDLIFTYNGGLGLQDSSFITFQEQTYLTSQNFDFFVLTFNNGSIFSTNQVNINEPDESDMKIWSYEQNIYVNAPDQTNGSIHIFNLIGQEVRRKPVNPGLNVISLNVANSYYIVKVVSNSNTITKKLYIK